MQLSIQSLARRAKRVVYRQTWLNFGRRPPTSFIIIARSRTGSNHLLSLLDSHPGILTLGNPFRLIGDRNVDDIYAGLARPKPFFVKAAGFKVFYYHPNDRRAPELWEPLLKDRNIRVIHLRRRDRLATHLSRLIADRNDRWVAKSYRDEKVPSYGPIEIDYDTLRSDFIATRDLENDFDARFADHPMLQINYEDLVADQASTFAALCRFLGVPERAAISDTTKLVAKKPSELIANFEALKQHFEGSEWESFFHSR